MFATIASILVGPLLDVIAKYAMAWLATKEAKAGQHARAAASFKAAQIIAAKPSRKAAVKALEEGDI
jgi:hypothetical protein